MLSPIIPSKTEEEQNILIKATWSQLLVAIKEADELAVTVEESPKQPSTGWNPLGMMFHKKPDNTHSDNKQEYFPMFRELCMAIHHENPDRFILRFLRARKWKVEDALHMIVEMLKWRAAFGVRKILEEGEASLHEPEMKRMQTYFVGFDKDGLLCWYVFIQTCFY